MLNTWESAGVSLDEKAATRFAAMVRRHVGISNNRVAVNLIDGDTPPCVTGERGGHFTKAGDRIEYPGAYGKRGFGNMVYRSDSRIVTVGRNWSK